MLGIPETSLTENIEPSVKLLLIENNCPAVPSKVSVPSLSVVAPIVI